MKKSQFFTLSLGLMALLWPAQTLQGGEAVATKQGEVAYEAPLLRHLSAADVEDRVFLDSVLYLSTNGTSVYNVVKYGYTDDGYISSVIKYNSDGEVTVSFGSDEPYYGTSYLIEYDFDDQRRCVRRSTYSVKVDGSKNREVKRIEARYEGDRYYENVYEAGWQYDDATEQHYYEAYLDREKAYDEWDNLILLKRYYGPTYSEEGKLREYCEQEFIGPFYKVRTESPTQNYRDDYWSIQDRRTYYLYANEFGTISGKKKETVVEGEQTTITWYTADTTFTYGKLEEVDFSKVWKATSSSTYNVHLNADGTRPLTYVNATAWGTTTKTFEWDAQGRVTRYEYAYQPTDGVGNTYVNTYTYHDSYARPTTLDEVLNGRSQQSQYGTYTALLDNDPFFFGHLDTYTHTETETERTVYDEYKPSGEEWYHCFIYHADGTVDEQWNISETVSVYTQHEDGRKVWYRQEEDDLIPAPEGMATLHYQTTSMSTVSKDGPWQILMEHNWGFDELGRDVYFMVRRLDLETRTYAGEKRVTVYASPTDYGTQYYYTWDDEAPDNWVLIEESYRQENTSFVDGDFVVNVRKTINEGVVEAGDSIRVWNGLRFAYVDPIQNYQDPLAPFDDDSATNSAIAKQPYEEHYMWNSETKQWEWGYNSGGYIWEKLADGRILETGYMQVNDYDYDTQTSNIRMATLGETYYTLDSQDRVTRYEYLPGEMAGNNGSASYASTREYDYYEDTPYVKEVRDITEYDGQTYAQPTRYYYHRGNYVAPLLIEQAPLVRLAFSLNGRTLSAAGKVRVYDAAGRVVAAGEGRLTVPSGFLVVEVDGQRTKVLVK